MIREFEGELSGVLMERICQQWAEWWQMTSSSFVSPLDCLTSFLGISLSRAVSSFGRITNVPKLAITAESYIRSWRKPPEMPEVCRMRSLPLWSLIANSFLPSTFPQFLVSLVPPAPSMLPVKIPDLRAFTFLPDSRKSNTMFHRTSCGNKSQDKPERLPFVEIINKVYKLSCLRYFIWTHQSSKTLCC